MVGRDSNFPSSFSFSCVIFYSSHLLSHLLGGASLSLSLSHAYSRFGLPFCLSLSISVFLFSHYILGLKLTCSRWCPRSRFLFSLFSPYFALSCFLSLVHHCPLCFWFLSHSLSLILSLSPFSVSLCRSLNLPPARFLSLRCLFLALSLTLSPYRNCLSLSLSLSLSLTVSL